MDVNFEMALLELQCKTFLKDHQERMEIMSTFLRECDEASRKCEEASKMQEENEAALDEMLKGI